MLKVLRLEFLFSRRQLLIVLAIFTAYFAIMAFQIEVTQIEANYKLSQNRNDEDYWNIVAHLENREDELSHGVAEAMKQNRIPR